MKNYKQVLGFAIVWTAIVAIGLLANPERAGFNDRPVSTILQLLVAPVAIYFFLVWIATLIRNKKKGL